MPTDSLLSRRAHMEGNGTPDQESRRLAVDEDRKGHAKIISESFVLMSFPALLIVLSITKDFLQKHTVGKEEQHSVPWFLYGCILVSTLSSELGIMSWIQGTAKFHPRWLPKWFAESLIHFSTLMTMLTPIAFLLLFKENHSKTVYLVIFPVISVMACPSVYHIIRAVLRSPDPGQTGNTTLPNGNNSVAHSNDRASSSRNENQTRTTTTTSNPTQPENSNNSLGVTDEESTLKQLEDLLNFSASVTILLFNGMAARVYNYYKNKNFTDAGMEINTDWSGAYKEGNIEWTLILTSIGSIIGVPATLLHFLVGKTGRLKVVNSILLVLAGVPILTFSHKMLKKKVVFVLLPVFTALVFGSIMHVLRILFPEIQSLPVFIRPKNNQQFKHNAKPISLSFANIAFAGFIAASGYSGDHKDGSVHEFATFCVASALISALSWRFVNQLMKQHHFLETAEKVLTYFTLVLLILGVFSSMLLAFQDVLPSIATKSSDAIPPECSHTIPPT